MDMYLGEVRMFAGNYAPENWQLCNGQLLSISEYQALYALIGTTYGGDGVQTFGLPDLQGRVPIHLGQGPGTSNYALGQKGGQEAVALGVEQLPAHTHALNAFSGVGTTDVPTNNYFAQTGTGYVVYSDQTPTSTMANVAAGPSAGGNQVHENMMPFMAISYIIAVVGLYPQPS
jgi:microcystin-dependent protein